MKFHQTPLPGIILIEPQVFADSRGFFMETYHQKKFADAGIPETFVQYNHSCSGLNTLRGLHFQKPPHAQGKLVRAVFGSIFDVAVDIRPDSPTYGRWYGETLSAKNRRMLYIPPGFAHGFCVTSEASEVIYSCTDLYHPECESGILWSDPHLAIDWPTKTPILSPKDLLLPPFEKV